MRIVEFLGLSLIAISLSTAARSQEIDWQKVDDAMGRKAAVSGDVHRYGFPRTDLSVTLDGVAIKPALALGRLGRIQAGPWRRDGNGRPRAAGDGNQSGDAEADRRRARYHRGAQSCAARQSRRPSTCMSAVTAIPSKLQRSSAMRFRPARRRLTRRGRGAAADRSRHGATRPDHRHQGPEQWRRLPVRGAAPRPDQRRRHAARARRSHGSCRGDRFPAHRRRQGRDHRRLRSDGRRGQSRRSGRCGSNGIEVTALHSHMLDEQPRLFFLDFRPNDDAVKLARGLPRRARQEPPLRCIEDDRGTKPNVHPMHLILRRLVRQGLIAFALLMAPLPVAAGDAPAGDAKTIVFVCRHGIVNSQMAAAYFNKVAKERGLLYTAVSRGIETHLRIQDGLALDGLEPANTPDDFECGRGRPCIQGARIRYDTGRAPRQCQRDLLAGRVARHQRLRGDAGRDP